MAARESSDLSQCQGRLAADFPVVVVFHPISQDVDQSRDRGSRFRTEPAEDPRRCRRGRVIDLVRLRPYFEPNRDNVCALEGRDQCRDRRPGTGADSPDGLDSLDGRAYKVAWAQP